MKYTLINRFYYPGTTVLKNKAGITNQEKLAEFEQLDFMRKRSVENRDIILEFQGLQAKSGILLQK